MSNIKDYNIGQINLDMCKTTPDYDPPFVYYTHELPLLSFGDIQHNINLSLVFNYERYRDEKASGKNPLFIAPGFKLNLQKRLIYDENNALTAFQEEDGGIIDLKAFCNTYTFNDESQRILRNTQSIFTVENPDFSKETYNSNGRITGVYDKYNNAILSYAYNNAGHFTSITFRGTKVFTFDYVLNRIDSITYDGKTISFCYNTDGTLNYVQHYTGVKYQFNLYKADFALFDVDFGYKVTASENDTILCSKELSVADDHKTIEIIDKNGTLTVNKVSYKNPKTLIYENPPFEYVDIIDNNGVVTRAQFDGNKIFCSYELKDDDCKFYGNTPQNQFAGNVTLYNATGSSDNNRAIGVQTQKDGMLMNYNPTNHEWKREITDSGEKVGYYIVSGWIKSDSSAIPCDNIKIGNSSAYSLSFEVNLNPVGEWKYFSIMFNLPANTIYVNNNNNNDNTAPDDVKLRDLRVTFQETGVLSDGNVSHTNISEYVLLSGSNEISFNDAKFYYTLNGSDHEIKSDDETKQIVTFSDIMKYKLRKKRDGVSNEVYYNNCKNIVKGTTDLKVSYNGSYASINNYDIGVRVFSNGKKSLTVLKIYENDASASIVKTHSVTGTEISREYLDNNLNIIKSTVDGVSTDYLRNSQGLVTRQSVSGLYRQDISYTDTLITVTDVNPDTSATLSTTKYHIDSTWGGIYKVEMPDGSVITDTYDGDMSALMYKSFDNNSTRQHSFAYSKGRLASITGAALNYAFGYTADTGEIANITKNSSNIQQHAYSRSSGETTVTNSYPSASDALHTETKLYDKYGRLKSINGVLENLYDLSPYWYYFYSGTQYYTTMDSYNRTQHGELKHVTKDVDGEDALLAQTTDSLTGEVTKYGYDDGKLTAAVTYNSSDSLKRQETFVYDKADRLTKDRFDYNLATGEYVISDIEYIKSVTDPLVDGKVSKYSFKVNGTEKAKTESTYDSYKRVTNKKYTVGGKEFTKGIEYDNTEVNKVVDSVGGTTEYVYDSMGRISREKDGDGNILKSYAYDSYGQLIREDNKLLDKTFIYEYNNNGCITIVKEYAYTTDTTPTGTATEKLYIYSSTHPDRLTSFDRMSASYNSMGCPTTYNGYTASWTRGKLSKLTKAVNLSGIIHNYYYSYNAFGQRTSRSYTCTLPPSDTSAVVIGSLTAYSQAFRYDQSGRLIYESKSNEYYGETGSFDSIVYLYDENGIIGIVYTSESGTMTTYYFQRNLLGDVIGIYNTSGTKVGEYAYDAWGNCTINLDTTGIANRNPIRYRGYYYDQNTKLYYLNARYYSPEWRRFISPDDTAYLDPENVNGLNLYAYCGNDPVNYVDPSGHAWEWSTFWTGLLMVGTAITAIALSVTTFGAGIPLAMSIAAGITLGAGVLTGINGVATMIEANEI